MKIRDFAQLATTGELNCDVANHLITVELWRMHFRAKECSQAAPWHEAVRRHGPWV